MIVKKYIKPKMEYVVLTVEERFASGSCTSSNGLCSINGITLTWA